MESCSRDQELYFDDDYERIYQGCVEDECMSRGNYGSCLENCNPCLMSSILIYILSLMVEP